MQLAFERFGNQDADIGVLFIHGHTSSKESFYPIKDKFPDYNCLAVDLRGHGNSPLDDTDKNDYSISTCVEDIHNIVEKEFQVVKSLFILGHSMGARIAVPYALTHKTNVCGVIIEDIDFMKRNPGESELTEDIRQELMGFNRQFKSLEDCETALLHFGYQQSFIDRWKTTDRIRPNEEGYWCAIHPWVSRQCSQQILGTDGTADFRNLARKTKFPVLLMLAENASAASDYGIQKMKSIMSRMQSETFAGSTHSIHRTNPDEFADSLKSFVQKCLSK